MGNDWISVNDGFTTDVYGVFSLTLNDSDLFAGTEQSGVWRRSLSDFGKTDAISPFVPIQNFLTTYPNPFTQSTTITFTTPESGAATVTIVNILGTAVARIFSGELSAGEHSFIWDATSLPPGMYECIVRMNGQMERMAAIKN
jgi:hypothetical protein